VGESEFGRKIGVPKWMVAGLGVVGAASIYGLGYRLYTAVQMVRSGRGLESYRTFWLVEFNWIALLVLFGILPLALLVGLLLRLREDRQWKSLEKQLGRRRDT
jgi:hypothetical protein